MVKFLMQICKLNFGEFEENEFKKFMRMGLIMSMIIGIYWTMRPLKDSIFRELVGDANQIAIAKMISVLLMIPFIAAYTKLLDFISKPKLLSIAPPLFYGTIVFLFSWYVLAFQSGLIGVSWLSIGLGYLWYFIVESFGSMIVALFWSFSTDITKAESAKKGFPLVYTFGQLGQVILPLLFITLPLDCGLKTNFVSMMAIFVMLFLIPVMVKVLIKKTPAELMVSQNEKLDEKAKKKKTGFIEGLRLLFSHKYLICMFLVNFFFEVIATIIDFNFKILSADAYAGVQMSKYLAMYSTVTGIVTLVMLLLGVNKITYRLGLKASLVSVPIFIAAALVVFSTTQNVTVFFCLMVACKAANYSLQGPSLKQLYIPTSPDVKSKAQAWIETFGSRVSKEASSNLNALTGVLGKATYKLLCTSLGFTFVAIWIFVALYLGKTHKKAIDTNTNVC